MLHRSYRALCAAAVISAALFAAGPAVAKPVEGHDSVANYCRGLQTKSAALVKEYGLDSTTGARRLEILRELRSLGFDWNDLCKDTWGDITVTLTFPAKPAGSTAHPVAPPRIP